MALPRRFQEGRRTYNALLYMFYFNMDSEHEGQY